MVSTTVITRECPNCSHPGATEVIVHTPEPQVLHACPPQAIPEANLEWIAAAFFAVAISIIILINVIGFILVLSC